jgi:AraC-like DNA-binding protein
MALFEPIIPARYAAPLLSVLAHLGPVRTAAALAEAGVTEAQLHQPQCTLTVTQFDALITALAARSGRGDLGFELGQVIKLADHQLLGAALLRCATLDELLRLLVRFSRLITPIFALQYLREGDHGQFTWRPAAFMSPATLRVLEEVFAVSTHLELQAALGQRLGRCEVQLSMQAPPHAARYDKLRPTRFVFGAQELPAVTVTLPAALLDQPLLPAEQGVTPADLARLQSQQRGIARSRRWADWVTVILREAEGCQPSRAQLAQLLTVSPTSLTRQLAAEGCNLRELGKRIRHERACALLKDRRQPITQIAYRLGYRDGANFSHAFRVLAGLSPQAYRNANAGPG